ncbi:hypothetical protein QEH52_18890 [Coraliomargarita sp. SDUM461003]|uniref:Toxin co-regulated pilus biosynthesis protein Q C-terminal domain-containing protein n=1 Tax=Thalassobacterium maritimum TaxID=3041265 RepID=A0ABU1AZP7_9BACT|nr:hypothetical protein [Coraliomargarita sp. SDUM461003]MDQ8209598.1 hypothetical protein [Coraliomargarita sp. SDUM461003]
MKAIVTIPLLAFLAATASATDWDIPDPITYEWTIQQATKTTIPKVNFTDTPAKKILEALSDSMAFPLSIEAPLVSEEKLNKRITIHKELITWIEVISIVADEIEVDILISKGTVTFKPTQTQ